MLPCNHICYHITLNKNIKNVMDVMLRIAIKTLHVVNHSFSLKNKSKIFDKKYSYLILPCLKTNLFQQQ